MFCAASAVKAARSFDVKERRHSPNERPTLSDMASLPDDKKSETFTFPQVTPSMILQESPSSLDFKVPLIPGLDDVMMLCTTKVGTKRFKMPADSNFDLRSSHCFGLKYNFLHDPHLKTYLDSECVRKRLTNQGLITEDGFVKCSTREFNEFRQWIRRIKLNQMETKANDSTKRDSVTDGGKCGRQLTDHEIEIFEANKRKQYKARKNYREKSQKGKEERKRLMKRLEQECKEKEQSREEHKKAKEIMCKVRREEEQERESLHKIKEHIKRSTRIQTLANKDEVYELRREELSDARGFEKKEKELKAIEKWKRRQSYCLKTMEKRKVQTEKEISQRREFILRRNDIYQKERNKRERVLEESMKQSKEIAEVKLKKANEFLDRAEKRKEAEIKRWRDKHSKQRSLVQQGIIVHSQNKKMLPTTRNVTKQNGKDQRGSRRSMWNVHQCLNSCDESDLEARLAAIDDSVDHMNDSVSHMGDLVDHIDDSSDYDISGMLTEKISAGPMPVNEDTSTQFLGKRESSLNDKQQQSVKKKRQIKEQISEELVYPKQDTILEEEFSDNDLFADLNNTAKQIAKMVVFKSAIKMGIDPEVIQYAIGKSHLDLCEIIYLNELEENRGEDEKGTDFKDQNKDVLILHNNKDFNCPDEFALTESSEKERIGIASEARKIANNAVKTALQTLGISELVFDNLLLEIDKEAVRVTCSEKRIFSENIKSLKISGSEETKSEFSKGMNELGEDGIDAGKNETMEQKESQVSKEALQLAECALKHACETLGYNESVIQHNVTDDSSSKVKMNYDHGLEISTSVCTTISSTNSLDLKTKVNGNVESMVSLEAKRLAFDAIENSLATLVCSNTDNRSSSESKLICGTAMKDNQLQATRQILNGDGGNYLERKAVKNKENDKDISDLSNFISKTTQIEILNAPSGQKITSIFVKNDSSEEMKANHVVKNAILDALVQKGAGEEAIEDAADRIQKLQNHTTREKEKFDFSVRFDEESFPDITPRRSSAAVEHKLTPYPSEEPLRKLSLFEGNDEQVHESKSSGSNFLSKEAIDMTAKLSKIGRRPTPFFSKTEKKKLLHNFRNSFGKNGTGMTMIESFGEGNEEEQELVEEQNELKSQPCRKLSNEQLHRQTFANVEHSSMNKIVEEDTSSADHASLKGKAIRGRGVPIRSGGRRSSSVARFIETVSNATSLPLSRELPQESMKKPLSSSLENSSHKETVMKLPQNTENCQNLCDVVIVKNEASNTSFVESTSSHYLPHVRQSRSRMTCLIDSSVHSYSSERVCGTVSIESEELIGALNEHESETVVRIDTHDKEEPIKTIGYMLLDGKVCEDNLLSERAQADDFCLNETEDVIRTKCAAQKVVERSRESLLVAKEEEKGNMEKNPHQQSVSTIGKEINNASNVLEKFEEQLENQLKSNSSCDEKLTETKEQNKDVQDQDNNSKFPEETRSLKLKNTHSLDSTSDSPLKTFDVDLETSYVCDKERNESSDDISLDSFVVIKENDVKSIESVNEGVLVEKKANDASSKMEEESNESMSEKEKQVDDIPATTYSMVSSTPRRKSESSMTSSSKSDSRRSSQHRMKIVGSKSLGMNLSERKSKRRVSNDKLHSGLSKEARQGNLACSRRSSFESRTGLNSNSKPELFVENKGSHSSVEGYKNERKASKSKVDIDKDNQTIFRSKSSRFSQSLSKEGFSGSTIYVTPISPTMDFTTSKKK